MDRAVELEASRFLFRLWNEGGGGGGEVTPVQGGPTQNLTPEMQVISVNKTTDNTKIDQDDSFLSPLMDLSILNRMD